MKEVSARVLRTIQVSNDPDRELERLTTFPHSATSGYYVRLYDVMKGPSGQIIAEGNLRDCVEQLERDDIPSVTEEYKPILIDEYQRLLSRGETLYMFTLTDYVYLDEFEDEMDPTKPEYEMLDGKSLEGWLTIDQVCQARDIDKSTVTRAIYARELICGQTESDGRRFIKDDTLFKAWLPVRKRSYLRDRRLLIAFELLSTEYIRDIDDLYDRIIETEKKRFIGLHLPEEGLDEFFDEVLDNCPQTLSAWKANIYYICIDFGLDKPKKHHRGIAHHQAA